MDLVFLPLRYLFLPTPKISFCLSGRSPLSKLWFLFIYLFLSLFLFFSTRGWTQGLMSARQVLTTEPHSQPSHYAFVGQPLSLGNEQFVLSLVLGNSEWNSYQINCDQVRIHPDAQQRGSRIWLKQSQTQTVKASVGDLAPPGQFVDLGRSPFLSLTLLVCIYKIEAPRRPVRVGVLQALSPGRPYYTRVPGTYCCSRRQQGGKRQAL